MAAEPVPAGLLQRCVILRAAAVGVLFRASAGPLTGRPPSQRGDEVRSAFRSSAKTKRTSKAIVSEEEQEETSFSGPADHPKIWRAMVATLLIGGAAFTALKWDLLENRREDQRRRDTMQETVSNIFTFRPLKAINVMNCLFFCYPQRHLLSMKGFLPPEVF